MSIPVEHKSSIDALISMIPLTAWGEIKHKELELKEPWTSIGADTNDMFKVKAISEQDLLFVKRFAPTAKEFAQVAAIALQDLASLDLPVSVLGPTFVTNDVHAYKLGVAQPRRKILEILKLQDLGRIEAIVERFKLVSIFGVNFVPQFMKVDTVLIEGQLFIVDPFDDSADSVGRYLHKDK